MAGLFDNLVKGLSSLAPQDDPDIKLYNIKNELQALTEKETAAYAALGRRLYEENGAEAYPETKVTLDGVAAQRTEVQQRLAAAEAEKAAKEKAAAEAAAAQQAEEAARTCPGCGALNPEGTKFCQECGTKLGAAGKRFCTGCGAELKPGMRFCGECGARQEG